MTGTVHQTITSPCINVCQMNPATGWCEGCLRSIEEITAWGRLNESQRMAICADLPHRRTSALKATPHSKRST